MNTRAPGNPPSRRLTPALLLAVAVLASPRGSAEAGCGSHDSRPAFPTEWARAVAPAERPAPADRLPTCSGPNCSRTAFPPITSPPKALPRPDLCAGTISESAPRLPAGSWVERPDELSPIGRETEIERPPSAGYSG